MVTQLKDSAFPEIDLNREYTMEEFSWLPDDGNRYELIDGRLRLAPATGDEHTTIAGQIFADLWHYLRANPVGKVWVAGGFYIGKNKRGKDNVPEPDLGYIVAERVPPTADAYPPYPDFVVEVWSRKSDLSSKTKRADAVDKIKMFLNAGTRLAWGVNPIDKTVSVYHRGQEEPEVFGEGDTLSGEDIIPGWTIPVAEIFRI